MTDKKKPYDVLVAEEYSIDGEIRTKFYSVGVAFENSKGGFNVELPAGIALSGRFVVLPRRSSAESAPEGHESPA